MARTNTASSEKTWQQTKSKRTRYAILDAAVDCFYEHGYFNTTTEHIARNAGVSRGAMLHHFATRFELVKAAVEHMTRYLLEGMAMARAIKGPKVPEKMILDWLKRELGCSRRDVLTTVTRSR